MRFLFYWFSFPYKNDTLWFVWTAKGSEANEEESKDELELSDADWLIQLARSKWHLEQKEEAMEIYDVAIDIKNQLNGDLSEQNVAAIRELCDWRKLWDDKPGAIQLLLKLIDIYKQRNSEDNILFSPLFNELGAVYEGNLQYQQATESYFSVSTRSDFIRLKNALVPGGTLIWYALW